MTDDAAVGRLLELRDREPGHAVVHALLTDPTMQRPRGPIARFFGTTPLTAEGKRWYRGAQGEFVVGRLLTRLDERWIVMHAVPVGRRGADIDHLVVGPAGVFTINTKNHSGQRVWVAGRNYRVAGSRCDYIRNSEFEASRASKLLTAAVGRPVAVKPLIAVLDPKQLDIKERPAEVEVMVTRRLIRWLRKRPVVLTPDELAQLAGVIGLPATWSQTPEDGVDRDRRNEFSALEGLIRRTRFRRRLWASAAVVAVVLVGLELVRVWPWPM
jgi:hypothetical protein